jgi:hypothetical protein
MTTTNAIGVTTAGGVAFSGTVFKGTALTAYSVLTGAANGHDFAPLSSLGTTGQVLTSQGAGAAPVWDTINLGSTTWTDQATAFTAVAENGYFSTAAVTATLPATPAQGTTIYFAVDAATGALTVTAAASQKIRLGNVVSASAGTCVSTAQGDSLTLTYRASDTTWIATSVIGNWTIST